MVQPSWGVPYISVGLLNNRVPFEVQMAVCINPVSSLLTKLDLDGTFFVELPYLELVAIF